MIGLGAPERLYALPSFRALNDEIDHARQAIVDGWPRTASGALTNASGRAIAGAASKAKKLAHLVQGVEVQALRSIVQQHSDDIVLLRHDGFVSRKRLDPAALERAAFDATGYTLRLEQEQLKLDLGDTSSIDTMKTEMALDAPSMLDSVLIDVD